VALSFSTKFRNFLRGGPFCEGAYHFKVASWIVLLLNYRESYHKIERSHSRVGGGFVPCLYFSLVHHEGSWLTIFVSHSNLFNHIMGMLKMVNH
jgi:hypothetical protein